jgi:hypothetical protein
VCSSTIVSRILTYGAYPCTGAHCEVVGRCCVVWVDVGRCSVEGRVAEAMEVVVYGLVGGCGDEREFLNCGACGG